MPKRKTSANTIISRPDVEYISLSIIGFLLIMGSWWVASLILIPAHIIFGPQLAGTTITPANEALLQVASSITNAPVVAIVATLFIALSRLARRHRLIKGKFNTPLGIITVATLTIVFAVATSIASVQSDPSLSVWSDLAGIVYLGLVFPVGWWAAKRYT